MVGIAHSAPFVAARQPARLADRAVAHVRDFILNKLPFYLLRELERGKFDFIGLNYYCRTWSMEPSGSGLLFGRDWLVDDQGTARRYSDIGWEVQPDGLLEQLRAFRAYGVPLVVTEKRHRHRR
jgi:beta-glucosidase/6-phospho-beta-glucosidase/beta-galactosidase